MDYNYYQQFYREERAGLYKEYKYPNLIEVQKADHLHLGYFANVTDELVLAAFRGEEELTDDEIRQVARYNGIPFSVLTCPKLIMLDCNRIKHRRMIAEVDKLCIQLKCMAREGNQEAEKYTEQADRENQKFLRAVHYGRLTYIHYLDTRKGLSDYIIFSRPEPKKRGITDKSKGGQRA